MHWLSGFDYRKSHSLNAISGSGSNYQVKIKVCYSDSYLDMVELKERVTWTDWDAYDGVCHDGTYHYCQIGNYIRKFNDSGTKLATSPYLPPSQDPPVCGDPGGITYYNNMIYLALGDYTPAGNGKIVLYNASDLSYNSIVNISGDVPAGYCPADISYYGGYFWVVIHKGAGNAGVAKILKYNTSFVFQSSHDLPHAVAQGIDWKDNYCYVNSQRAEGYDIAEYYLVKYDSSFIEVDKINTGPLNCQWGGIGFDPNTDYLWISGSSHQNQGWILYMVPPARNQVSLEGHCLTNFGDVRFTDNDGSTELSYYMDPDEGADGEYRYFWVKITDDLTSNQSIYIYYGKAGATTTSNGLNTFIRFSDFENHNIGDLPSAEEGWEVTGETSPNTGRIDTDPDDATNKVLKCHQYNTGLGMGIVNTLPTNYWGVAIHYRIRSTSIADYTLYHPNREDATDITLEKADGNSLVYYTTGYNEFSPVLSIAINTWYKMEEQITTNYYHKFRDGAGIYFGALRNSPSVGINKFLFAGDYDIQHDYYLDKFFVRKFTSEEMGVNGTWEEEETSSYSEKIFIIDKENHLYRIDPDLFFEGDQLDLEPA